MNKTTKKHLKCVNEFNIFHNEIRKRNTGLNFSVIKKRKNKNTKLITNINILLIILCLFLLIKFTKIFSIYNFMFKIIFL